MTVQHHHIAVPGRRRPGAPPRRSGRHRFMARRCRVPSLRLAPRPTRDPGVRGLGWAGSAAVDLSRCVVGRRTGKPSAAVGADHEGIRPRRHRSERRAAHRLGDTSDRSRRVSTGARLVPSRRSMVGLRASRPRRTTSVAVRGGVCRAPPPDPRVGEVRHSRNRHRSRRLRQPSGGTERAQGARPALVLGPPSGSGSARVEGRVRRVLGLDIGRRQRVHRHSYRTGRRPLGRWPTPESHSTIGSPASRGVSNGWRPALPTTSRRTTPLGGVRRRPGTDLSALFRFCGLLLSYCGSLVDYLRSAA